MSSAVQSPSPGKTAPLGLPELRPARLEDNPQIERLESSHGLRTLSQQDWSSLWLDNPIRPQMGDAPIGWVLENVEREIVGSLANILSRYRFRGNDLIAATGRAWVVMPAYRGVALCLMDEYFNQPGVDLFLNTTVNSMAVDPFTSFGSERVPVGDWENAAYWVTGYRGFAATALRLKNVPGANLLSVPASAALLLKDTFSARSLPKNDHAATIELSTAFDDRFDAFWAELVKQNPSRLLGYRDRQTLAWHFAGPLRSGQLWIFTATVGGLMRAYCILKRQDHPQSGLIRMRLVDYQTLLPDVDLLPALLRAALKHCEDEGIYTFEHVGCGLQKMRAFDQHAPYRRRLPAWPFYYHAPEPTLRSALQDHIAWDPSTFDGDASL
jgi:hypothetical protein